VKARYAITLYPALVCRLDCAGDGDAVVGGGAGALFDQSVCRHRRARVAGPSSPPHRQRSLSSGGGDPPRTTRIAACLQT
jgi:hypothetical protein